MDALLFMAGGRLKYEHIPFTGWREDQTVRALQIGEYIWVFTDNKHQGPNHALRKCGMDVAYGDVLVYREDRQPITLGNLLERMSELDSDDDGRTRVVGGMLSGDLYSYISVSAGWPVIYHDSK
jgi:hypothetical protein